MRLIYRQSENVPFRIEPLHLFLYMYGANGKSIEAQKVQEVKTPNASNLLWKSLYRLGGWNTELRVGRGNVSCSPKRGSLHVWLPSGFDGITNVQTCFVVAVVHSSGMGVPAALFCVERRQWHVCWRQVIVVIFVICERVASYVTGMTNQQRC